MMKFQINQAKAGFFDRVAVMMALNKMSAKVLPKAGAFVMRTARSSIKKPRKRKSGEMTDRQRTAFKRREKLFKQGKIASKPVQPSMPSRPGEPPRGPTGLLKKHLFFSYDPATKSVVVGPALLNKSTGAPAVLEQGGPTEVTVLKFVTRAGQVTTERSKRVVTIEARPYMAPAYKRNEDKIRQLFRDSVKG